MRDKVRMLIGSGMTVEDVATVMGCVRQTLYTHFADEIGCGRLHMRAEAIELAWKEARGGSMPAIRKVLELSEVPMLREDFVSKDEEKPAERLGKKEQRKLDVQNPDTTTPLGALIAQRMSGGSLN